MTYANRHLLRTLLAIAVMVVFIGVMLGFVLEPLLPEDLLP